MLKIISVTISCLLISSCGLRDRVLQKSGMPLVTISAIASSSQPGKKYVVVPASESLEQEDPLLYSHLAQQVKSRLTEMGYSPVDNVKQAEQVILLDYRRSGAMSKTENIVMPVWGQNGISSATTQGNVSTGTTHYLGGSTSRSAYSETTTYTPSYGVTGYQNALVTNVYYSVGVSLQSIDAGQLHSNKKSITLWRVTAISTGNKPDSLSDYKGLISMMSVYAGQTTNTDFRKRIDPSKMF
ncbi:hypothetical protein ACFFJN_16550 [Erwinia mallotivora]|uniref:hypothetical protein n=1 Tax=Erwinia mallotivora TaxID=69222 RepID=UPI0035ED6AA5